MPSRPWLWSPPVTAAALAAIAAAGGVAAAPATAPVAPTTARAAPVPADQPSPKLDRLGQPNGRWLKLHDSFSARGRAGPIGVLFLGDSITQRWSTAPDVWEQHYGSMQPANFGIGGDRTEHVLWRVDHGELDGIRPRVVVLLIGTNNSRDTAAHIAAADEKIVAEIRQKLPDAKLLLLGIFPRGVDPADPAVAKLRTKFKQVNAELAKLDDARTTRYLDLGNRFLSPDGTISKDVMPDAVHPTPAAYRTWADAMQPLLEEMMK